MKKIANIVSSNNVNVSDLFNVVKTMDEIHHGLPTLIIDYDYVVKHFPDFDITNIVLAPNIYWTLKKNQSRDKHTEDLNFFINKVYEDLFKQTTYFFVDVIQYKRKSIVKTIRKIYSIKKKYTYFHNDMVYIYGDNIIFGIDLKLLKFIGLDVNKVKNKIKEIRFAFFNENDIFIEYNQTLEEIDYKLRYIPYIISLKHEENNTISNIYIS